MNWERIGAFLALLEEKLDAGELPAFLQNECGLTPEAARNLQNYLAAQKRAVDCLPTVRRLVVEEFPDEAGEWRCCSIPLGPQGPPAPGAFDRHGLGGEFGNETLLYQWG